MPGTTTSRDKRRRNVLSVSLCIAVAAVVLVVLASLHMLPLQTPKARPAEETDPKEEARRTRGELQEILEGREASRLGEAIAALEHPSAQVRGAAVLAVAAAGGEDGKAKSALIGRLSDTDAGVRRSAVRVLGERAKDDPAVVAALCGCLSHDDAAERMMAALKLGDSRSKEAVRALVPRLRDPEFVVRQAAARSLEALTGRRVPERDIASNEAAAAAFDGFAAWWKTQESRPLAAVLRDQLRSD